MRYEAYAMRLRTVLAWLGVAGLGSAVMANAACVRRSGQGAPGGSSDAGPSTAASPAPNTASTTPSPTPSPAVADPMAALTRELGAELLHRTSVHPSVDDGFAAIEKAGYAVPQLQQSLARTYKASYCRHGVTATANLGVLLCEYPDLARAGRGFQMAKRMFPGAATRHTSLHKTLVVVITFQDDAATPAASTAEEKIVAALDAL